MDKAKTIHIDAESGILLGTPIWFARGCENAAGKLSRGGKQQQGPISPNHVRAIKGPPVQVQNRTVSERFDT